MKKRSGLTLVELLVVIAILGVLFAISASALQSTKSHARAVLCQANIKELTTRLTIYELENETFPCCLIVPLPGTRYVSIGDGSLDSMGNWWISYITDYDRIYEREEKLLKCPDRNITDLILKRNILYGNYGVNRGVCKYSQGMQKDSEFMGRPLGLSNIKNPSCTLLIADCGYARITWHHVNEKDVEDMEFNMGKECADETAYIPGLEINRKKIDKSLMWGQEDDAINGRHPQKTVNVGFADGHIERKKASDLLVEKSETGSYKNRTPLWKPD
jgi:prepilin-type N-terminal cleavage/methylation domain-containing protein/prepilin-type processing-associated H-X9-DG protein